MTKARRKIDGSLKAKIALEALGDQATVSDLAQRYQVHPNQIYAWKKQLRDFAARAFDSGIARDADAAAAREIEKLHAKIWQLTIENDFFAKRFGNERVEPSGQARSRSSRSVGSPAMRDARRGAIGRLPQAGAGQRQRSGAHAPHRRVAHRAPVSRLAADRQNVGWGRLADQPQARAAANGADGDRSARSEAEDDPACAGAQDLSLPLARHDDRPAKPGLGGRHNVHSDRSGLPLSGRGHRLGEPGGPGVAAVEHDGRLCVAALEEALLRYGRPEIFN